MYDHKDSNADQERSTLVEGQTDGNAEKKKREKNKGLQRASFTAERQHYRYTAVSQNNAYGMAIIRYDIIHYVAGNGKNTA